MFDPEKENQRIATGGAKFSTNPETEAAMHRGKHLKMIELECTNSRCYFNKGNGECSHIEPAISLRFMNKKNGGILTNFVCWSTVERHGQ
jgi:hypothetical protein